MKKHYLKIYLVQEMVISVTDKDFKDVTIKSINYSKTHIKRLF